MTKTFKPRFAVVAALVVGLVSSGAVAPAKAAAIPTVAFSQNFVSYVDDPWDLTVDLNGASNVYLKLSSSVGTPICSAATTGKILVGYTLYDLMYDLGYSQGISFATAELLAGSCAGSVLATSTVSIGVGPSAPVFNTTALGAATVGVPFSDAVVATGSAVTLALTSGTLPAGVTFTPATGAVAGTPTADGTFPLTFTATSYGVTTTKDLSLVVTTPLPPVFTTTSLDSASVDQPYSTTVEATGVSVTIALKSGALPAGMTFNPATGVLEGTPTAAGTFSLTFTATSLGLTTDQTLNLVVSGPPTISLPSFTNSSFGDSTVGTNVSWSAFATNGTSTYAVTAGSLPAGATLSSATGLISGVLTIAAAYDFTVTATNETGSTSQQYAGTISLLRLKLPVFKNSSFPDLFYELPCKLDASATNSPTNYAVTSGSLPAGLTLNPSTGEIAGMPTEVREGIEFTIKATNADGSTEQIYAVNVVNPPTIYVPSASFGPGQALVFTVSGYFENFKVEVSEGQNSINVLSPSLGIAGTWESLYALYGLKTYTLRLWYIPQNAASFFDWVLVDSAQTTAVAAHLPSFRNSSFASAQVNSNITWDASADQGANEYLLTAGALPKGLKLNATTGLISGQATVAGTYKFTISATGLTGTATHQFKGDILPAPIAVEVQLGAVVFAPNSTILNAAAKKVVQGISARVISKKLKTITVSGHYLKGTSASAQSNAKVAIARAMSVKAYLALLLAKAKYTATVSAVGGGPLTTRLAKVVGK